jgi:hypothetical protein
VQRLSNDQVRNVVVAAYEIDRALIVADLHDSGLIEDVHELRGNDLVC